MPPRLCSPGADLGEDRPQVLEETPGILAHREMAQALHGPVGGAGDLRREGTRHLGRLRPVVLPCQQVDGDPPRVDPARGLAQVVIDREVIEVALEDGRGALAVDSSAAPATLASQGLPRSHGPAARIAPSATASRTLRSPMSSRRVAFQRCAAMRNSPSPFACSITACQGMSGMLMAAEHSRLLFEPPWTIPTSVSSPSYRRGTPSRTSTPARSS